MAEPSHTTLPLWAVVIPGSTSLPPAGNLYKLYISAVVQCPLHTSAGSSHPLVVFHLGDLGAAG